MRSTLRVRHSRKIVLQELRKIKESIKRSKKNTLATDNVFTKTEMTLMCQRKIGKICYNLHKDRLSDYNT